MYYVYGPSLMRRANEAGPCRAEQYGHVQTYLCTPTPTQATSSFGLAKVPGFQPHAY